jgi:magnesium-protoporphyrin O-methyltransferase
MRYEQTLSRVEMYFDKTATKTWERLTSDAPVSRIRQTVRAGRDEMRSKLLAQLPQDLSGARIMDAGCGPGQLTQELAQRGAKVVAIDISPSLIDIARKRIPVDLQDRIEFCVGDMCDPALGSFDHVIAMDSMIYYARNDLARVLRGLSARTEGQINFTVAPKTPLLTAMWYAGKLAPKGDKSPTMMPQSFRALRKALGHEAQLIDLGRVTSGFYISHAMGCHR